ncbi:hypothetical protein [Sphingomonas sp. SRS2]|uniref:hypothetical protein n=1 Tax=Sphingomonas sp. SRS2 TaxID=133190 RepID=UPI0006184DBC|nr:hypothetical protein [Sphingomonas sp. SRS2]KKC24889.1 hypothetical protein WP12_16815 [Sphingomonas sp. SRS2]
MMDAGGLTVGGLIVALGWLGWRLVIILADYLAEEIGRFFDIRGDWADGVIVDATRQAGGSAPNDHASDGPSPSPAHNGGLESEMIAATSGNALSFTGERIDA